MRAQHDALLDDLRPSAFAIAYRMLGSVAEAEDVVQEALLRVHATLGRGERIASPRAFVATVVTRLAIDELRSARARRERYVGEWLPEPLVAAPGAGSDPQREAELADSLSLAFHRREELAERFFAALRDGDDRLLGVMGLDVADGHVQGIRSIVNPDKLGHLGLVGDMRAMLRARQA